MRGYDGLLELRPSLIGSISCDATSIGSPVDTMGFADVMAVVVAGAVTGTDTNYGALDIKFQEGASATGTGALWSDITDGALNGSFDIDTIGVNAGTNLNIHVAKGYEHLGLGRSRFIRAHATMAGTDGCNVKFSVAFLLGRPNDTLYINNAVVQATGNVEYTPGL